MPSWIQTPYAHNPVRAVLLLLCRIVLGLVLVAHGWQKFSQVGLDAVTTQFTQLGVPLPQVSAFVAAAIELVGGLCIIFGACTWVACVLVALDMAGAYYFVHRGHGVLVDKGGWELVAAIGVAAVLLSLTSAGDLSIDGVATSADGQRRSRRRR